MSDSENRKRQWILKVRVTENEEAEIKENAKMCSLPVSGYLRNLGLNYSPLSTLDKKHVLDLAKVNGDQGRLGGLLKMWLTNDEREEEVGEIEVRRILDEIAEVQSLLLESVKKL